MTAAIRDEAIANKRNIIVLISPSGNVDELNAILRIETEY